LTQFSHDLAGSSLFTVGIWEYDVLLVFLALAILVLGWDYIEMICRREGESDEQYSIYRTLGMNCFLWSKYYN